MASKYIVDLTTEEYAVLFDLIKQGKTSARKVARAHILLQAAEGATDEEIADTLRSGLSTVRANASSSRDCLALFLSAHARAYDPSWTVNRKPS